MGAQCCSHVFFFAGSSNDMQTCNMSALSVVCILVWVFVLATQLLWLPSLLRSSTVDGMCSSVLGIAHRRRFRPDGFASEQVDQSSRYPLGEEGHMVLTGPAGWCRPEALTSSRLAAGSDGSGRWFWSDGER